MSSLGAAADSFWERPKDTTFFDEDAAAAEVEPEVEFLLVLPFVRW